MAVNYEVLQMKVIAIGEIIFDIFGEESKIGGAPLNFCAHCARLGAESAIVSSVGGDKLGENALATLKNFGVKTDFVRKNAFPTGQCLVTLKNGTPEYNVLRPAAYDKITADNEMIKEISSFNADVFAFGTLIQRDPVSRKAVKDIIQNCKFPHIFCDINLRPGCFDAESTRICLENADILKISSEEEPLLAEFGFYEQSADKRKTVLNICDKFPNIEILLFTKGENGSLVYSKAENGFYDVPSVKTEVVSTVGAGDSYSAAFICEYFKSGNILKAAEAGAALSSFVVSRKEAVPQSE